MPASKVYILVCDMSNLTILDHQPSFQSSQPTRYDLYDSLSHRRFIGPRRLCLFLRNRDLRVGFHSRAPAPADTGPLIDFVSPGGLPTRGSLQGLLPLT